jgi:DNA-directed RNA polymerase II subunit RPB2
VAAHVEQKAVLQVDHAVHQGHGEHLQVEHTSLLGADTNEQGRENQQNKGNQSKKGQNVKVEAVRFAEGAKERVHTVRVHGVHYQRGYIIIEEFYLRVTLLNIRRLQRPKELKMCICNDNCKTEKKQNKNFDYTIHILDTMDELTWRIIDSYFENNPQSLVRHHIESYNDFFKTGIFQIFREKNPITIHSVYDESIEDFRHQCVMYFGGKDGTKIYFGKPVIYDAANSADEGGVDNAHYMFPNEARLRNMTYGMTVHYDIEIEFIDILEPGEKPSVIVPEMMKKTGGSSGIDIGDPDYTAEIAEFKQMTAGNFKKEAMDLADMQTLDQEGGQGTPGQGDEAKTEAQWGGAPKKVERKKRVKSVEVEMTAAMAAEIREASEKSLKGNVQRRTITLEKIFLGKFPIMVQSEFCILNGLPREMKFSMGECKNDIGGYFIIDGKEKTVVPQEKFGDNMLYIRKVDDDTYAFSAEIRSVSENVSKPIRTLSIKIKKPTGKYSFENIVVNIPNVRNPVPLFVVFRALGIISDKEIITMCLLDLEKYASMVDLFIPSVHDAGAILTQQTALMYIASLTKYGTVTYALEILADYFLPHVGETNHLQKAYYLGYMVFRLLSAYTDTEPATDRDNFKFKRVELVGSLIYDLFREYYTLQQREIHLDFEKRLYYNKSMYAENLAGLIQQNYRDVLKERHVELGFRKAFKGNWGAETHTKRVGIVQDLNRLSYNSAIAHLRKTNLPLDASAKVVGPRLLHCSQWGYIDPVDTPDGGNIGLHKSLAMMTYISRGYSREPMIQWLREKLAMKTLEECGPALVSTMVKIMVNGYWAGVLDSSPFQAVEKMKLFRRNALLPIYTSVTFDIPSNTIYIYTDAGRVCRPIFFKNSATQKMSYETKEWTEVLAKKEFTWADLTAGLNKKKVATWESDLPRIYELHELYGGVDAESNPAKLERFLKHHAMIDYIDPSESENALIAMTPEEANTPNNRYTHVEIHESLIFGVMCNQIIFPENNPPTRNSFSCGQSKQAVSMYHTNFQMRMDKTAVVLNYGQIPLVKTRYLEHINQEENPYGENTIVAIMCYTGYNVEDAVLINEGALKRGLFNTTYYTVYETHEENSKNANSVVDKKFTNIEMEAEVVGTKPGYDYSKLDKYGIIRENTPVNDKTVIIGLTSNSVENKGIRIDMSKTPKKGQLGVVDKSFITEGEEGERIAKVRIREIRVPSLGDKMASRAGQKGTVGLVIPEADMPFTKDGLRPDIIINPHAIPTRMTIGQLVECITGKTCAAYGGFADCTAFNNRGSKIGLFGEYLTKAGYHSSGNEILYNGMTGEQLESDIFIGPTYYMRLKHMVKDKINFRALGPRTALTKQPVSGRANDGGLRIGEMERDVLIAHGMNNFLRESMMERGDKYYMAICNKTGMLSIYNPSKNIFMSPMADGPIQFTGSVDGKDMHIEHVTRFGRDFSVVCVPYSLKLLIQELQTMNIQMRLITEDNIEQLENLSFSKNIERLLHVDKVKTKDVVANIRKELAQSLKPAETPQRIGESSEGMVWKVQENDADTPSYVPYVSEENTSNREESPPFTFYGNPKYPDSQGTGQGTVQGGQGTAQGGQGTVQGGQGTAQGGQGTWQGQNVSMQMQSPEYKAGEPVFYRGGTKANRLWKIRDVGSGEFITIETDDLDGMEDIGDSIKVVSPMDIYRPSTMPEYPVQSQPMQGQPIQGYVGQGFPMDPYGNSPYPEINVNPVIKIVNGPDNSVDTSTHAESVKPSNQMFTPQAPTLPGIEMLSLPPPTHGGSKPAKEPPATTAGGEIDFNNLKITKV